LFITTGPLTLLTVASGLLAWQENGGRREWWLAATTVIFVERIATFVYFNPAILKLQQVTPGDPTINSSVSRWISLNHFRMTFVFIAWMAALRALTL
jgi:uncharacterized membrane protein